MSKYGLIEITHRGSTIESILFLSDQNIKPDELKEIDMWARNRLEEIKEDDEDNEEEALDEIKIFLILKGFKIIKGIPTIRIETA